MNISFPSMSVLNASLRSFHLQDRITLTNQQMAIAKIALVIFTFIAAVYLFTEILTSRSRLVTIIEEDGTTYRAPISTVNGKVKVIFDSFLGTGETHEGEFTDGKINGQGKITYPGGNVGEGELKDGKWEGHHTLTAADGTTILEEGEYKDNVFVKGKIRNKTGNIMLEGEFKPNSQDNKYMYLEGEGKQIIDGTEYIGLFKESNLIKGKITFANGTIVEGEFKDSVLIKGKKIKNGIVFEGEFKDKKLHGQGKITYADGKIEEGEFTNDFLNGQGKRAYPNGKVEEGTFKNNEFIG